ncbi:MAG: hypothetical protein JAZ02_05005 [Candidatus Thiodiazotropha endolucinida]|nr:hypothetical protein [Candidatus Thiodiazotropha endolucinida]
MMKKEMFDEFLESVQEMGEIVGGKKKASRSFDYPDPEVEADPGYAWRILNA